MTAIIRLNEFNQPIGDDLNNWSMPIKPQGITLTGKYCDLVPLNATLHANALFAAYAQTPSSMWTYLFDSQLNDITPFYTYIDRLANHPDMVFYAIIDKKTYHAIGMFALMRIDTHHGVIEVGNVAFSSSLQKTVMATEAHYLLMSYVFDILGYRRYEWKCDTLNAPSRQAALRLGFIFEGIFRQAVVYKNRSRDTAWFSIIDKEWPLVKMALQNWLSSTNFDKHDKQYQSLSIIRDQLSTSEVFKI